MKKIAALIALVVASLALAACGGSSDSSSTESTTQSGSAAGESKTGGAEGGTAGSAAAVEIEAASGTDLAFATNSASAKAGKVTVDFTNPQAIPHDVAIEDAGGKTLGETELVSEGSSSAVVDLKPGSYTFFCTVAGHREAGMEGTLTVK